MFGLSGLSPARWNLLVFAVLCAGGLFVFATRVRPAAAPAPLAAPAATVRPAPQVGAPAPPFRLSTTDGATIDLEALHGQVVLINFWAAWCPPCRAEMPAIQAVYEQYRDEGFIVLAVNQGEQPAQVAAFLHANHLSFPAPLDQDGTVGAAYRATALPSSFFVDRHGLIRAIYRGPMARSVIAGAVEQLVNEPGPAPPDQQ